MSKIFSIILGAILSLLGLLGFISNPLIGTNALFATDAAYNFIHIILGVILLIVAFWFSKNSVLWLKVIGIATFLLGLIGMLYANCTSNWLNLIAGIIIFIAGIYGKDSGIVTIAQIQ